MDTTHKVDDEQARLWNGTAGQAWVASQAALDQMFEPFERLLLATVSADTTRHLLDVGCGTGSTTLAAARRLGAFGQCNGIDISEPMLATARARVEQERLPASFIRADAQRHAFEPACFDAIISRFGVMFFEDPVQAFANLRRAAKGGAGLRFVAWRSPEENPFMTIAERSAASLLPNLPPRVPNAAGPFAFADRQRIQHILQESGWSDIDIRPIDVACSFAEPGLIGYLSGLGPLGRILHQADEPTRTQVIATVRAAFDPYVHGTEVRFDAACWMVVARAPAAAKTSHD